MYCVLLLLCCMIDGCWLLLLALSAPMQPQRNAVRLGVNKDLCRRLSCDGFILNVNGEKDPVAFQRSSSAVLKMTVLEGG